MESMWKNMGIKLGWNARIDDTMVVDLNVMTTCMSIFFKPFLDFDSMQKNSTVIVKDTNNHENKG